LTALGRGDIAADAKRRGSVSASGENSIRVTWPQDSMRSAATNSHHPNDPLVVHQQLRASVLSLSDAERVALLENIERQIAEIDARKVTQPT
jgi:hypothetical protein